jgi:hypothetical protein
MAIQKGEVPLDFKGDYWETFNYDTSRDVLAFNYAKDGVAVCLRLNAAERYAAHMQLATDVAGEDWEKYYLESEVADDQLVKGDSKIWWDYDRCCTVPKGEPGAKPDLMLYRDDHFSVTLPHEAGLELLEILRKCDEWSRVDAL